MVLNTTSKMQDVRDMQNMFFSHESGVNLQYVVWNSMEWCLRKHLRKLGFSIELPNDFKTFDLFSVEEYKGSAQLLSFS